MVDVLLLTPIGLGSDFWSFVDFGARTTIGYEYPGHGSRPMASDFPTLDELADEAAALCAGPVDVVGVSMGGMVAQRLALRHPELVRSLVLAATTARTNRQVMEQRATPVAAERWSQVVEETLDRWFSSEVRQTEPQPSGIAYAESALRTLDRRAWSGGWHAMADHDVVDRLPEIAVPVTCIAGSLDSSSPIAALAEIADSVQNGRLEIMESSHLIPLERPEQFSSLLSDHFDRADHVEWKAR